jgi:26S proteasome regulatory subunit N6
MDKQPRLEEAAAAKQKGDVVQAEKIYHDILATSAGTNETALREQESALIRLGELYRDQKFPPFVVESVLIVRAVDKLVELIKTSRTIMSNFAKAKTAKIGMPPLFVVGRRTDYSTDVD